MTKDRRAHGVSPKKHPAKHSRIYTNEEGNGEREPGMRVSGDDQIHEADPIGRGELEPEDNAQNKKLICAVIFVLVIFVLGVLDGMTTKYAKHGSIAFANWTAENAPWSFFVYCLLIIVLVMGCLPYGPLSILLGAVLTQLYGFKKGLVLGVVILFATTMTAAALCFNFSRNHFAEFVQNKVASSKSLRPLRNLEVLLREGQGFELVLLVRLAPLPAGPTFYFLGTMPVKWSEFLAGNAVTNFFFALTDIMIGAGASSLRSDNPLGIFLFLTAVITFFVVVAFVGLRAKRKLDEIDARETVRKSFDYSQQFTAEEPPDSPLSDQDWRDNIAGRGWEDGEDEMTPATGSLDTIDGHSPVDQSTLEALSNVRRNSGNGILTGSRRTSHSRKSSEESSMSDTSDPLRPISFARCWPKDNKLVRGSSLDRFDTGKEAASP